MASLVIGILLEITVRLGGCWEQRDNTGDLKQMKKFSWEFACLHCFYDFLCCIFRVNKRKMSVISFEITQLAKACTTKLLLKPLSLT
ncbi:hypothetical protein I3842_05G130200 [Carya illinoinensis]|uniref:Uncharacterized protein n=1 Tax=Carya illinoinensis TaxID=32201 RepID=A0A922F2E7_CARIL|nr:hypothetical protein I3842_05G130200 [Carya illinoinensis]